MKKRVLVTGSESQLAKCWLDLYGISTDSLEFDYQSRDGFNIASEDDVNRIFALNKYDYCLNCAAYTDVEEAEHMPEEAYKVNATGVENLVNACTKHKVVLIHISTDYVFDGKSESPYQIDDDTNPINVYGCSKLKAEKIIKEKLEDHYIVRTSWLYSPYGKNFVKTMVKKMEQNEPLEVINTQKGAPTSCYDLAEFVYFLINENTVQHGTYHFSAANATNWYEFAKHIMGSFPNYDAENLKPVEQVYTQAKRPDYSVLDLSGTKAVYPKISNWEIGVDAVLSQLVKSEAKLQVEE